MQLQKLLKIHLHAHVCNSNSSQFCVPQTIFPALASSAMSCATAKFVAAYDMIIARTIGTQHLSIVCLSKNMGYSYMRTYADLELCPYNPSNCKFIKVRGKWHQMDLLEFFISIFAQCSYIFV